MRIALYARISSDRSGDQAGVDRQIADCQALATERGWTVVARFIDNDVSAFSGRVRPQFKALVEGLQRGDYEVVVAYHVDRLYRRLRDLMPLLDICEKTGASVVTVKAGTLDLATASGRVVASILGAVAEGESARQAERIRREKLERALAGKPNGSMRSFGFAADGTVIESEAVIIRELVERILAGDSLRSMTADLNARGVRTVRGGIWRHTSLREMLMAARLSGQREHTPVTAGRGRSSGTIVAPASWDAIISPEETARVRQLLNDPARRTMRPGKHLLTGLLRCGGCGQTMNSHADTKGGRRYVCVRLPGTLKCGKRSVDAPQADELVIAVVTEALYGGGSPTHNFEPSIAPAVAASSATSADQLTVALKLLATDFANDRLSEDEFDQRQAELKLRRKQLLQPVAFNSPTAALANLPKRRIDFECQFRSMAIDRQRAVLRAALLDVELSPVVRIGTPKFDPSRFGFKWRSVQPDSHILADQSNPAPPYSN